MQYEFEQMQDCITALFDCFERVSLEGQPLEQSLRKLIEQNISFARKMVELSEKFDELYARPIDEGLRAMIAKVCEKVGGRVPSGEPREMLEGVLEELGRREKGMRQKEGAQRDARQSGNHGRESRVKRPDSENQRPKQPSTKQGFALKRMAQQQQQLIRELFDTCNHIIVSSQLPLSQKYRYQKYYAQQTSSAVSLARGNLQNNGLNLLRLKSLMQLMQDDIVKSIKRGVSSQGKVSLYLEQIQKREEVFSYTISKVLEGFRGLALPQTATTKNLEELVNGLFDLYPSAELMRDLSCSPTKQNIAEYIANSKEVQANFKSPQLRKQQLQSLRLVHRISDWSKRLLTQTRNRKQIQFKDLQKYLDLLKQTTTLKDKDPQLLSWQQQLLKLQQSSQKHCLQLKSEHTKALQRYQKTIKNYQSQIEALKQQITKLQEKHSKTSKKVQNQKEEVGKMRMVRENLERVVQAQTVELEKMRAELRNQQKEQSKAVRKARSEQEIVAKELERAEEDRQRLREVEQILPTIEEERNILRNKVRLIEQRQQHLLPQQKHLKQQLQTMISDNSLLKQRFQHLSQLYEQKLKQSQDLISQFRQAENELSQKDLELQQLHLAQSSLKQSQAALKQALSQLQEQLQGKIKECEKALLEKGRAEENARRFKELGMLNEEDIGVLKEEIEKVKNAYLDSEEQLQALKEAYHGVAQDKTMLTETKGRYSQMIEELETELQNQRRAREKSQQLLQSLNQQLRHKDRQSNELSRTLQSTKEQKRELLKLRRQNAQLRSTNSTLELQIATLKHDLQNITIMTETTHSQEKKELKAQNAKYQLELESIKVDLKNTREELDKERRDGDRERGILQQRVADLKALLSEKENLSNRLRLAKQYESVQES